MMFLLTLLFTCGIGLFSYYYWHMTYWSRRNIAEPAGKSLMFGHFYTILDNDHPIMVKLGEWSKKYGKTFGLYEGLRKVLVTSDVDMINEVFVKQFDNFHGRKTNPMTGNPGKNQRTNVFIARGARWKRLRTITAPSFSNANLKKINGLVEDSAMELVKHLEKNANSEINIREYFQEFTLDVISRLSLGQPTSQIFNNPMLAPIVRSFEFDFRAPISMLAHCTFVPILLLRIIFLLSAKFTKDTQANIFVDILGKMTKTVDERVKQREDDKKRGIEPGEPSDFIDLFLDARADDIKDNMEEFSKNDVSISKNLTYEEIKGQLMIFLLAGFDTTANALSYAAFFLTKNPEKMRKLQQEIDRECTNTAIDFETLGRLKYLEAVFKETLRMYPLASSVTSRLCMKTTKVGNMEIEEGTFVLANAWAIHYDKEIYGQDADQFVPERWLNGAVYPPATYLPFGHGSRICIGMRLAFLEAKLALCHILRKFDIVEGSNTGKGLVLSGATVVHPRQVNVLIKSRG
ncbi:hypothetical protein WR25_26186 [Diploscapter pachys]|uniref:Cytochrome P450 n=1 Tax=Diploscapter pachys TaxID=2018661 RepID=A0A2A2KWJ6_9BILA|nr:hypothetical protein WR25_26186 [Diploscapter pachys]